MASSTLFGYTLEERDGNLVITVHGTFAETVVRYLREELTAGRGLSVIQRLSPLGPLRGMLARRGAEDEGEDELFDLDETSRALNADEILNQGVDQSLDAFEQEMKRFKSAMDASGPKKDSTTATGDASKGRGGKASRRVATRK